MICGVMMMKDKKSKNYSILRQLTSKSRRFKLPSQTDYIILYTFLYKYCSDIVKEFLLLNLKNKELTIDEAYENKEFSEELIFDSLKMNGFYIKKSDAFIEEVASNYTNSGFLTDFLKIFPEVVIFNSEYHNSDYFENLFKVIDDEIDTFEFSDEETKNIGEIIYLISQLNVFDSKFDFKDAFDIISASHLMHINSNPEFVTQVLSSIVSTEKKVAEEVYDPFIKDGSSIMYLYEKMGINMKYCYGKDESKLNYFHTIVRFFINDFSLNDVFLKQEDALESIDINGSSFDVILSRIPIAIKNYYSSNITQNMEIEKRNKRIEIENLLLDKLGMDENSFKKDSELNKALDNLVEKIHVDSNSNLEFVGEFESLKDSEFLFLINLIDSLKSDGIMAITISENFLFKNSLETLRKYLTSKKNYIDAIIRIPNEIVRSRPEVVIVFKKNKTSDDVLFIDMSADYETMISGLIFSGLFRKNILLDNETISKMENVFSNKLTLQKYSNLISLEEIQKNNFNLSVSRYVDTFEGEFISLNDLIDQKQEIESNINDLNLKIDKMMDDLNIHL